MKKFIAVLFMVWIILVLTGAFAYAGPLNDIKTWLFDKALYAIIPLILGFGAIALYTDWICLLLVSVGGLLTTIGLAFMDRTLDKKEQEDIKAKWFAFQAALKKRPEKK